MSGDSTVPGRAPMIWLPLVLPIPLVISLGHVPWGYLKQWNNLPFMSPENTTRERRLWVEMEAVAHSYAVVGKTQCGPGDQTQDWTSEYLVSLFLTHYGTSYLSFFPIFFKYKYTYKVVLKS